MDKNTQEALTILLEECSEVIQVISKIFRFGMDNNYNDSPTNKEKLQQELGDLLAMVEILKNLQVLDDRQLNQAIENKFEKLRMWSSINSQYLKVSE